MIYRYVDLRFGNLACTSSLSMHMRRPRWTTKPKNNLWTSSGPGLARAHPQTHVERRDGIQEALDWFGLGAVRFNMYSAKWTEYWGG